MDASLGCNIVALNAKAIQMVQKNDDRNAIKLFLQALGKLKSELNTCNKHKASPEDGAFLRVPMTSKSGKSPVSSGGGNSSGLVMFDRLLGLCSNVDPCAPEVRDGATALLLYNAGVTEHHMALFQDTSEQQKTLHLRKAAQIYNMAFSAAQHWKRYTIEHPGYSILCLAILNNLLSIQSHQNSEKTGQLLMCLRNSLAEAKSTITEEEHSFFAKNLDQLCNNNNDNNNSSHVPVTGTAAVNNESSSSSTKLVGI